MTSLMQLFFLLLEFYCVYLQQILLCLSSDFFARVFVSAAAAVVVVADVFADVVADVVAVAAFAPVAYCCYCCCCCWLFYVAASAAVIATCTFIATCNGVRFAKYDI